MPSPNYAHALSLVVVLLAISQEMEAKILQGTISFGGWQHSSTAKDFIQSTAMVNPGMRLSSSAALLHPWIAAAKEQSSRKLGKSTDLIPNELVMSVELYRMAQPLKRVALNALARKMTTINKAYKQLFLELDTTGSGTLTKAEFLEGFKHTGNNAEEMEDLFQKLDINCNGVIMFTEFLAATLEAEGELEEAQLQEAFDLIDTKKTGYITNKDLTRMLGSDPKVKESIQLMLKGKSKVSFDDFAQLFEHSFGSGRGIDPIAEMSLNEEQLSLMKADEVAEHMASIKEMD
jgi:Ca2+-binding EF-hand superfamily protein